MPEEQKALFNKISVDKRRHIFSYILSTLWVPISYSQGMLPQLQNVIQKYYKRGSSEHMGPLSHQSPARDWFIGKYISRSWLDSRKVG